MKRIILTLSLFLLTVSVINAQKCKPKFTHTDDFTEVTTELWGGNLTSMSVYSLNVKYIPSMFVYKEKDKYKIVIGITVDGKLNNDMVLNDHKWFEKGSTFMFKLENDLLTFVVEKGEVRQSGGTSAEVTSTITKEQIEMLRDQQILKGRVYPFEDNQDMVFQFKVSKSRDKKIKKQLDCLLKQ
jgi:hypothetical protein